MMISLINRIAAKSQYPPALFSPCTSVRFVDHSFYKSKLVKREKKGFLMVKRLAAEVKEGAACVGMREFEKGRPEKYHFVSNDTLEVSPYITRISLLCWFRCYHFQT